MAGGKRVRERSEYMNGDKLNTVENSLEVSLNLD